MRLSWNEIKICAAKFSHEWADETYEKGEAQSFYNDFFKIFGVKRRSVARYEQHVKKLDNSSGFIDLFWPGVLLVEQKSAGLNLADAYEQAGEYFDALPEEHRPRYILVSDFQNFELHNLSERKQINFTLKDLPEYVTEFSFIKGKPKTFRDQDPVNIKVAELMGDLHDSLKETGYKGYDLERLLVRIIFCLFADDTGIFEPRDIFLELIETRTNEDGSDLGSWLNHLFQVMDTPEDERFKTLDEDLARFPYINGELFRDTLGIASFTSAMRSQLLKVCHFDWSNISPAIFGAFFQSAIEPEKRRSQGAHYTTEKNILKVIEPLFLDDLRAEFKKLKALKSNHRRKRLQQFQKKLASLNFFDPACGCGTFLIIAYREIRLLEIEVIRELRAMEKDVEPELYVKVLSLVDVDQFYGIELEELPARIAETALWMMDHIMNNKLSLEFGHSYVRIPLRKSAHILHEDALETNWKEFLKPEICSFVFGNPPYSGAKQQKPHQRSQVHRIVALGKTGGTLDYVAAWFILAGEYIKAGKARIGFVSTNSITQGEQVAQLWPILFDRCNLEISFAHRTFVWGSEARGKAHVHVVIIGLDNRERIGTNKCLFSYPDINGEPVETQHTVLSPYLFDASGLADPHLTVQEERRPINKLRRLKTGVQMIDNGILTFTHTEYEDFISVEPGSRKYFRKYIGGDEYINGFHRWILYLADLSPSELRHLPRVRERIRRVREYRASSRRANTVAMSAYPTKVGVDERLSKPFLVLPNTSSERRDYIPIGWLNPDVIANQKLRILPDATLTDFALLTSAMHMAWVRAVTGRMKSDYMYSVGVVYNTFPTPPEGKDLSKLETLAQNVLDARASHPDTTLADLYDPDSMPNNLRQAHQSLDRAVDRLYRSTGFTSEHERLKHLFMLYEKTIKPLKLDMKTRPKRQKKKRTSD